MLGKCRLCRSTRSEVQAKRWVRPWFFLKGLDCHAKGFACHPQRQGAGAGEAGYCEKRIQKHTGRSSRGVQHKTNMP